MISAKGAAWVRTIRLGKPPPNKIRELWNIVVSFRGTKLTELEGKGQLPLIRSLLDLMAISDSACRSFGLPHKKVSNDKDQELLLEKAEAWLIGQIVRNEASTLARRIDPQILCVLPKVRTPQTGLTIRSLSHHLAIWPRDETMPRWHVVKTAQSMWEADRLNLLLIPWPFEINAGQFQPNDEPRCGRHYMDDRFRCFDYQPLECREWLEEKLPELLKLAASHTGDRTLHGVVLPELAMKTMEDFVLAYEKVHEAFPQAFLLSGMSTDAAPDSPEGNYAWFAAPLLKGDHGLYTQAKHHRWQLDSAQIKRYRLSERLETGKLWWESMPVSPRVQNILALKKKMTFSFLICEDLARQEPASRLLRAVGPNLVIALLLDGQQLEGRWPGRYASVLAEDPGSSVLTLTSLGMVLRGKDDQQIKDDALLKASQGDARPPGCNIGLWRDKNGVTHPISIHPEDHGVVLSLTWQEFNEYSADGRKALAHALVINEPSKDIVPLRLEK